VGNRRLFDTRDKFAVQRTQRDQRPPLIDCRSVLAPFDQPANVLPDIRRLAMLVGHPSMLEGQRGARHQFVIFDQARDEVVGAEVSGFDRGGYLRLGEPTFKGKLVEARTMT
jgi:hypothetical protein